MNTMIVDDLRRSFVNPTEGMVLPGPTKPDFSYGGEWGRVGLGCSLRSQSLWMLERPP